MVSFLNMNGNTFIRRCHWTWKNVSLFVEFLFKYFIILSDDSRNMPIEVSCWRQSADLGKDKEIHIPMSSPQIKWYSEACFAWFALPQGSHLILYSPFAKCSNCLFLPNPNSIALNDVTIECWRSYLSIQAPKHLVCLIIRSMVSST